MKYQNSCADINDIAPNSLPTGVASSQEQDQRTNNIGSAPNSLPARSGSILKKYDQRDTFALGRSNPTATSKLHIAGAVLSSKTLFSQNTGSFGSQSHFYSKSGIPLPPTQTECHYIELKKQDQDDSFAAAGTFQINQMSKQDTEYLPSPDLRNENIRSLHSKEQTTFKYGQTQGQILKGIGNNKEEIIVYTNPYDLAIVNKNLNSPGLFGLSSSLYLNESHGTYKQAMSSKNNKDIHHLSDESFGQQDMLGGKSKLVQLSDISKSNIYSRHLIQSHNRKKDQQRQKTAVKIDKTNFGLVKQNQYNQRSPGAYNSGDINSQYQSSCPNKQQNAASGINQDGQNISTYQVMMSNHDITSRYKLQKSGGKFRKIIAESIQDQLNGVISTGFLNANKDEIMTLKDIAVKTPNLELAQSANNEFSKQSSKDRILDQIYSQNNPNQKPIPKTQKVITPPPLKLTSQNNSKDNFKILSQGNSSKSKYVKSIQPHHFDDYFAPQSTKNMQARTDSATVGPQNASFDKKRGSQQPHPIGIYQSTKNIEFEKKNLSHASNELSTSPQMIGARMSPPRISGHDVSTEHLSSQKNITKQLFKLPSQYLNSGLQSKRNTHYSAQKIYIDTQANAEDVGYFNDQSEYQQKEHHKKDINASAIISKTNPLPDGANFATQNQQRLQLSNSSKVSQMRQKRQDNIDKLMQYTTNKSNNQSNIQRTPHVSPFIGTPEDSFERQESNDRLQNIVSNTSPQIQTNLQTQNENCSQKNQEQDGDAQNDSSSKLKVSVIPHKYSIMQNRNISADIIGTNRRLEQQKKVGRMIENLQKNLDASQIDNHISSANILNHQTQNNHHQNSKKSLASQLHHNYNGLASAHIITASSPKFPGIQNNTNNSKNLESSSMISPDSTHVKNNFRYSLEVQHQHTSNNAHEMSNPRKQSSQKGSVGCSKDLAHLTKFDKQQTTNTNIQDYLIASAHHSSSKYDSIKSKSRKRRKVLLSNNNGRDQINIFNNDATQKTVYSGRFDSMISSKTKPWLGDTTNNPPIIGHGHNIALASQVENEDFLAQEELLSAGTDGNTQYNEIMKKSKLETHQKPFSPFPKIPKAASSEISQNANGTNQKRRQNLKGKKSENLHHHLDIRQHHANIFSQKNFKKEKLFVSQQCSESGTLAGSPTHNNLSEDNRSSQRMKFGSEHAQNQKQLHQNGYNYNNQHHQYPVQEQLVIQHIRNLKKIQFQKQKTTSKPRNETKNCHHFHRSKVQSPLSIQNIEIDQIRSSSTTTAHKSRRILMQPGTQLAVASFPGDKMIDRYINNIQNRRIAKDFSAVSQCQKTSKAKVNATEELSRDFQKGYQEVGKFLKNIDLPSSSNNDDVLSNKKLSSKVEDSVVGCGEESVDTPIKEINTSLGTQQNQYISIFGPVDKKLSSALNFQCNKVITQTQLDRFANNKNKYQNTSVIHLQESLPAKKSAINGDSIAKEEPDLLMKIQSSRSPPYLQLTDETARQRARLEDLEIWRRQKMADQLYFICASATSKRGRRNLYKSMPESLQNINSKIKDVSQKPIQTGAKLCQVFPSFNLFNQQFARSNSNQEDYSRSYPAQKEKRQNSRGKSENKRNNEKFQKPQKQTNENPKQSFDQSNGIKLLQPTKPLNFKKNNSTLQNRKKSKAAGAVERKEKVLGSAIEGQNATRQQIKDLRNNQIQISQIAHCHKNQQVNTQHNQHDEIIQMNDNPERQYMQRLQDQLLHLEIPNTIFSQRGISDHEKPDTLRNILNEDNKNKRYHQTPQITFKSGVNNFRAFKNKTASLQKLLKSDQKSQNSKIQTNKQSLKLRDFKKRFKTMVSKVCIRKNNSASDSFQTRKLSTVKTIHSFRIRHQSKSPIPKRKAALNELKQRQVQFQNKKLVSKFNCKSNQPNLNSDTQLLGLNHLDINEQYNQQASKHQSQSPPKKKRAVLICKQTNQNAATQVKFNQTQSNLRNNTQSNKKILGTFNGTVPLAANDQKSLDCINSLSPVASPKSNNGIKSLASILDISNKMEDIIRHLQGLKREPSKKVSQATRCQDSSIQQLQKKLWERGIFNILDREDLNLPWMQKEEKLCPQLRTKQSLNQSLGDLFTPGANGNVLLIEKMNEVRREHRSLLRKTLSCVDTRQTADRGQIDPVINIHSFKSENFVMQQCKMRHLIIDNVKNKKQPLTVTFTGVSGELEVFVSHKFKFPSEVQNHGVFNNTNVVVYAPDMIYQGNVLTVIDDNDEAGSGSRRISQHPRFKCNQIYLSIETTQQSSQVQAFVKFGNGKPKTLHQIRKLDTTRNNSAANDNVTSPQSTMSAVDQMLLNLSVGIEEKLNERSQKFFELNDGQQAFQLMMTLLNRKFRNVIEKTQLINQEVEKIVSSTETANQFLRQVENFKQQIKQEQKSLLAVVDSCQPNQHQQDIALKNESKFIDETAQNQIHHSKSPQNTNSKLQKNQESQKQINFIERNRQNLNQ